MIRSWFSGVFSARALAVTFLFFLSGCAGVLPPDNNAVPDIGARLGYRSADFPPKDNNDIQLLLSFSGGGVRAASLSYGVLLELKNTQTPDGGTLLDKVDYISAVSGGSFTAAYYGLFGDEIFEKYEKDFLKKSTQSALLKKIASPDYWYSSIFSGWNRTEMAADYYDQTIFNGKTFGDIQKKGKAFIEINATELSHGSRFAYTQEFFDLLCSDVSAYPVAKAVMASSAVPVLFPPVPLKNYADRCVYNDLPALDDERAFMRLSGRKKELVNTARFYRNITENPYLHLVDGGIVDNLGVHAVLDRMAFRFDDGVVDVLPKHLVIIMVNAEVKPANGINQTYRPPTISETVSAITDNMMNRYSFESGNLIKERVKVLQEQLDKVGSNTRIHLVKVDFESIKQPTIKRYFNNLPTSLELKADEIDNLVLAGRNLLRQSPDYQVFINSMIGYVEKSSVDACFSSENSDCSLETFQLE